MPTNDADIKEIRGLFSHDDAEWRPIRDEGTTDMRHVAGDPWESEDKAARKKAGRVALSLDELGQYINQAINEVRSNKRAVAFAPTGNGANDDTAEFYADKMREIEYRSRAQIGYTTAFENCIQRSYGFVRVNTRYMHARAVNQDIYIDPVPNPDLVIPDTQALMPDLSDMQHCWVREAWSVDDFDKKWAKNKVGRFIGDLMKQAPGWFTGNKVFVGEHWYIKHKKRKLLIVQPVEGDAIGMFEDEIEGPLPGTVLETREVDDPTVYQCLTNGIEKLEETTWAGKYIPIVGCLGKVLYVDEGGGTKRKIMSMVRLARDPYMLYCYYRTCQAEIVGMTPKIPYFVYEGQLADDQEQLLAKSLHEPVAVVKVKAMVQGMAPGTILPHPQRQIFEPPIQALEAGAEAARRAIQAAMGLTPLPTAAQRRNEKSGVALERIEEMGQKGSFHFTDHYLDMITQVGVICEDLMDEIYDTARDVGVRRPNDTADTIRINDPADPKSVNTKGDHLVTVSTGPSFDSEREAASDFADTLASSKDPAIFNLLGPLIVKLKNLGPIGDEMAELLEAVQPPQVQQMRQAKEDAPDPQRAAQALAQLQAQAKEAQGVIDQLTKALEEDHAKQQATIAKAQMDQQTKVEMAKADAELQIRLQEMKNAATIRVAEINAAIKGYQTEAQHAAQHESQALGIQAELVQGDLEREHDDHEAERDRQVAAEAQQAQMAHEGEMAERSAQDGAEA